MDLGLHGKTALVTGASRGLGFATALELAREGAQVAINARNLASLETAVEKIRQATGVSVFSIPGDVTAPGTAEGLVQSVVAQFGALDILVANAGGPPPGSFESHGDETWMRAVELSLMSNVRLIRAALPHLKNSSAASVLTVTSYSAKQPIPNLVLSNTLRAAVLGLTKSLALELGGEGIRFNSILPGWTQTERVTELMTARARNNNSTIEDELVKQAKESPFGRMAKPEEFARAAAFLVSPAAAYITGVMLTVDGGMYKGTI